MSLSTHDGRQVLMTQPRLWIEAMLEEYDHARTDEAKEAILGRIGAVLVATYAIAPEPMLLTRNSELAP